MTARDRWHENLNCPICGKTGVAHLSQWDGRSFMDDQSTTVQSVTEGFGYKAGPLGVPRFYCKEHPGEEA